MSKVVFGPLKDSQVWRIENPQVAIKVERKTGLIRSLVFKRKKIDLFEQLRGGIPGYAGGLRIYDERDRRWYSDLADSFRVTGARKSGNKITFGKQFTGAPFKLKVTLDLERDALTWQVQAEKVSPKVADRSLRVYFQMPMIAGWQCWAPCKGGQEFAFDGMTSFEFMYLQVPWVSNNEVILPMVSHFSKQADVGYSMLEPIDAQVPAAKFQFSNGEKCFAWGNFEKDAQYVPYLETVNYMIGLVGRRPMHTQVMLIFHEGCWRPALGKVYRRWKKYFDPANSRMYEMEGVFHCTSLEFDIAAAAKAHLKTLEVHNHFEHYSIYYNEKPKWLKNSIKETLWRTFGGVKRSAKQTGKDAWQLLEWIESHTDRQIAEQVMSAGCRHVPGDGRSTDVSTWTDQQVDELLYWTPDRIRDRLKMCREHGIHPFWYFNYTDGFRPAVEQRWPDSIGEHEDGSKTPSGWQMCHNMVADPKYSFGKYLIDCARKIVREYPDICGFFLDCFRHYEIDFAHDDGITVVNHKPAYSVNFSYDDIETAVKKILHRHNMCTFANKPQTIRSMRWCDGMMLEGNGDQFEEKYFWSAIALPIIFLWTTDEAPVDENLRRSVLHGCFPKMTGTDEASIRRVDRYMPLYEQFRRRVFCFDPDPIRVPAGSRAKLYTVGDDYVAGIVNTSIQEGDRFEYHGTPNAIFRVQRGHDVTEAGVMYPGDQQWRMVKFHFNGTFLIVPMEQYTNCAVVKLFVRGKSGKKIGKGLFPTVIDTCGDPQSAFENLESL